MKKDEFFYPLYEDGADEQELFMRTLYHAKRDAFGFRMIIDNEGIKHYYASRNYDKLAHCKLDESVYITVNPICGYRNSTGKFEVKRDSKHVRYISSIYIDLDLHHRPMDETDRAVEKTKMLLINELEAGRMQMPTMICETGRGLAFFFCLSEPISALVREEKAEYDRVSELMRKKFEMMLSKEKNVLELDPRCKDLPRLCRLPLTVNQEAQLWCHLVWLDRDDEDGTVRYTSLEEIYEKNHLDDVRIAVEAKKAAKKDKNASVERRKKSFGKTVPSTQPGDKNSSDSKEGKKVFGDWTAYHSKRLREMEILQELRGEACVNNCREYMSFIFYNEAVQCMDRVEAVERVKEFNEHFTVPLPANEIDSMIRSVDSNEGTTSAGTSYAGYYILPDGWIQDALEMTDEEIKICSYKASAQYRKREENKKERKTRKQQRNASIVDYIQAHPEMTYEQVAEMYGVSLRTLYRICEEAGIRRHSWVGDKKAETRASATAKATDDGSAVAEKIIDFRTAKYCSISYLYSFYTRETGAELQTMDLVPFGQSDRQHRRLSTYMVSLSRQIKKASA